jgi:predicted  nucleic acid-binding Zn-ribbon protein
MGSALLRPQKLGGGKQVNPDLRNLIALQDLELKIANLQKQAADIPSRIQSLNAEIQLLQTRHQERAARMKELSTRRRALEGEVDLQRSKLSRLKDQRDTSKFKSNRDFAVLLHEIQTAEEHVRTEEDKILDIMEEAEGLDKDIKTAEQAMLHRCAELQEEIRQATESVPRIEAELVKLRDEKIAVESQVDSDLLFRYRRIAEVRKGVALAEAKDELCSVCHVRIRPQMYADLLRTENIQACDSCSRILFTREHF